MNVSLSPASLTPEQIDRLWRGCSAAAQEASAEQACRSLSTCIAEVTGATVAVFRRDVAPWKLAAKAGLLVESPVPAPDAFDPAPDNAVTRRPHASGEWTCLRISGAGSKWMLLLQGNWQSDAEWLPRFVETAGLSITAASLREHQQRNENLAATGYAVARRLGQISDERQMHQFVIDTAARAVSAERGTLARYEPKDAKLAMAATFGYPVETVEHLRVAPGAGLVGGVFASRKPLLVRDVTRLPWVQGSRRRYKTRSFLAVPLLAGNDPIGVLTLADRADGAPFDRGDLTTIRMLAAPAALALSRQRLAEQTTELAHLAAVDPLTGLFNRRYLQTRLAAELERARREQRDVALVMLDIDQFKSINDRWGHAVGDAVMQQVSHLLRRSVRVSDVCTRFGGDEFAIVVPEAADTAIHNAERIRQRVEAFAWNTLGAGDELKVTVSLGVAMAAQGEAPAEVITRADARLYEAKAAGRNCVRPFEP